MRAYYRPGNYSTRNSVGYLIRMANNRALPQLEGLFESQELTFSQWTTLMALYDGRASTAGELARNICHDAGSLTRLIDQLVRRGFVDRRRSEQDRRVVTLALTTPGRRVVEALMPRVMAFWNGLLAEFKREDVDTLIALLTRLGEAIRANARDADAPPFGTAKPTRIGPAV